MNYYIQGNKEKAQQIRAAFEKLGYDVTGFDMCNDNNLFFTYKLQGGVKVISTTNANLYTADIIKTHPDYMELPLPVEPKFKLGDNIKTGNTIETIAEVGHATRSYYCKSGRTISFTNQDLWELDNKPHYDIKNFKPFDHCRFKPTETHDWIYADFWYIQAHYKVECLSAIEKWES